MAERFDSILSECIDRVLQGESLESCLARYPEQSGELAPLLRTALAARQASAVEPRPDFKARVRYEVHSRAAASGRAGAQKGMPFWGWVPRWAVVVAAVFLVVLVAGSGTVAASSGTVPGDTLYSVKTGTERVRLFFAFSDVAKAKLQAGFAGRRVREMARIARRGDVIRLEALRIRFNQHLARVDQLAARIAESDIQNAARIAELEEILYRNMARDDALLEAAYEEAPLALRPAIEIARLRLMQSYEGAIDALRARYGQQTSDGGGMGWGWSETGGTVSPGSGMIVADPVAGSAAA
ncbi:MAG: hypothetical protein FJ020_00430 [Chloroflexi bacterium]|nr:hypothetical protein [Chloroflexota bacterium]